MSEMNHALFVLVLNSLYNTQQFTFFLSLSLCPFSSACPLRTAPVHLNTDTPFLTDLWSLLILLGFSSSLPPRVVSHVDPHNMGVLIFSSLSFRLFHTYPTMLWNFLLRAVYLCHSIRGHVCRVPPHLHKLGVELRHAE